MNDNIRKIETEYLKFINGVDDISNFGKPVEIATMGAANYLRDSEKHILSMNCHRINYIKDKNIYSCLSGVTKFTLNDKGRLIDGDCFHLIEGDIKSLKEYCEYSGKDMSDIIERSKRHCHKIRKIEGLDNES